MAEGSVYDLASGTGAELRRALGRRVREARGERTAVEVAATAGISLTYLSEVENGHRNPSALLLGRLAVVLGVTTDSLIYEPEEPTEVERGIR